MREQTKIMKKHLEELEGLKENAFENYIKDEIDKTVIAMCKDIRGNCLEEFSDKAEMIKALAELITTRAKCL